MILLDKRIKTLPNIYSNDTLSIPKLLSYHNSSYIDCFFTFLTSKLLHTNNFIHGIDFYGTFLGIQEKYKMNVTDDIEYLLDSTFFIENINKYFSVTNNFAKNRNYLNNNSRANKNKLKINSINNNDAILDIEILDESENNTCDTNKINENESEEIYMRNDNIKKELDSESDSDSDSDSDSENDSLVVSDDSTESITDIDTDDKIMDDFASLSDVYSYMYNFPIQMICMEKCNGTLDELFDNKNIHCHNAISYLFQIVMILLTFQKLFKFTHNDLHTNNIMYIDTDIEFIYYKFENNIYKVPTYGKIFKIIDFGRSIYWFQNKIFCSDSFNIDGDAHSQYNFPPFYNNKKPIIYPNFSFDICRLGCSIFDFIMDIDELKINELDEFQKIIYDWCCDDDGKNVLYKKNGEERYPNFKLYKMIAKTVHNHTPNKQLERSAFKQFLTKEYDNNSHIFMLDIDKLPTYF